MNKLIGLLKKYDVMAYRLAMSLRLHGSNEDIKEASLRFIKSEKYSGIHDRVAMIPAAAALGILVGVGVGMSQSANWLDSIEFQYQLGVAARSALPYGITIVSALLTFLVLNLIVSNIPVYQNPGFDLKKMLIEVGSDENMQDVMNEVLFAAGDHPLAIEWQDAAMLTRGRLINADLVVMQALINISLNHQAIETDLPIYSGVLDVLAA